MGTLQENQSLNAEYERNKKEREMREEIERLLEENERLQEDLGETTKLFAIEKEKNRQAVEYIEEHKNIMGFYEEVDGNKLLEILKGTDKE